MMNNYFRKTALIAISIIMMAANTFAGTEKASGNAGICFEYFYDALSPYGDWIEIEDGLYAWNPVRVASNWQPYSYGRWMYTSNGWYWDSSEPYAWAVYHYGRWYNDSYYGWLWLPDNQWAPAWVEWRYDDYYIGWAPLSPYAAFSISLGLHFTREYHCPVHHWHYVNYKHFSNHYVYNHYVSYKEKSLIHERTKTRNNYEYRGGVVNRGVDRDFIESRSGRKIAERGIYSSSSRISSTRAGAEKIAVFRPSDVEINKSRERGVGEIKRSDRKTGLSSSEVQLSQNRTSTTVRTDTRSNTNASARTETRNSGSTTRTTTTRTNTGLIDRTGTGVTRRDNTGSSNRTNTTSKEDLRSGSSVRTSTGTSENRAGVNTNRTTSRSSDNSVNTENRRSVSSSNNNNNSRSTVNSRTASESSNSGNSARSYRSRSESSSSSSGRASSGSSSNNTNKDNSGNRAVGRR